MRKFRKFFSTILLAVVAFSSLVATPALADGMIVYPEPYPVYEKAQKALIIYEDNKEILVLTTDFEGSARDFGWIVPTPNKPEVERVREDIFDDLADLTKPKRNLLDKIMYPEDSYYGGDWAVGSMELSAPAFDSKERSTVVVHEQKKVGIYDIAVLSAEDVTDLEEWLDENGYQVPEGNEEYVDPRDPGPYYDGEEDSDEENNEDIYWYGPDGPYTSDMSYTAKMLLQDYIDTGWYFVAVKVNNTFINDIDDYSGNMRAINPIRLEFKSSEMVFPMKITSLAGKSMDVVIYTLSNDRYWVSNYDLTSCYRDDGERDEYNFEKEHNTCSEFVVDYGSTISKSEIEEITSDVGRNPWYKPDSSMYIARHVTTYLSADEMDSDVVFEKKSGKPGLNDGSMTVSDWIKLPFIAVLYAPRNLILSIGGTGNYGGTSFFFSIVIILALGIISIGVCIALYLLLKRTTRKFWRVVIYLIQLPFVWIISRVISIVVGILFGLLINLIVIHPEVTVLDAVIVGDIACMVFIMMFYRFQWRKKKVKKLEKTASKSKK